MANIVKKNVSKGTESTVIVAIASILAVLASKGLKQLGVELDETVVIGAITTVVSGVSSGIKNWWDHRK